jgi:hypothetical protein
MDTRRTAASMFLVVVLILLAELWTSSHIGHRSGLSSNHSDVSEGCFVFDERRSTDPFIYIYMSPKYPLPGEDVVGGLKVAVWQDGKVVRARTTAEVGKSYIQGKLRPEQLNDLIRLIEQSGILATQPNESSPLHEATDVLKIRTRGGLGRIPSRTWKTLR